MSRAAPLRSPGVLEHRNRPQCDIAHQPDLGHISSVGERLCNDRELAPTQISLRWRLAHPEGCAQNNLGPSVAMSCYDALQEIGGKLRATAAARALHRSCDLWVVLEPRLCDELEVGQVAASS